MKIIRTIILATIVMLLMLCLTACKGNNEDIEEPGMCYQSQELGFADRYYSIRKMTVWQDNAYILALDQDVVNNNLNRIVIIDSDGNKQKEISYKAKDYVAKDGWWGSSDVIDMDVDENGDIWLLEGTYSYLYNESRGAIDDESREYCVSRLDGEGNEIDSYALSEINDINNIGDAPYVHSF